MLEVLRKVESNLHELIASRVDLQLYKVLEVLVGRRVRNTNPDAKLLDLTRSWLKGKVLSLRMLIRRPLSSSNFSKPQASFYSKAQLTMNLQVSFQTQTTVHQFRPWESNLVIPSLRTWPPSSTLMISFVMVSLETYSMFLYNSLKVATPHCLMVRRLTRLLKRR